MTPPFFWLRRESRLIGRALFTLQASAILRGDGEQLAQISLLRDRMRRLRRDLLERMCRHRMH